MKEFLPKILSVDVTNHCNNNCIYCRDIHNNKSRELGYEQIYKSITQLVKQVPSFEWIKLSGGEPLLFKKVEDLIYFCAQNQKKTILQTNGILLSHNKAKALREKGLTKVQISLDGDTKINDYLRGHGSYKKIINAINACVENDLSYQIKCTISNVNKDHLESLFKIAYKYKPEKINFRFLLPIGRAKNNIFYDILPTERRSIIEKLNQLSIKYGVDIITGDPCSYVYLFKYLRKNKIHDFGGACTIGINSIHISSDGFYRPCSMISLNLGDILKDDFYNIWENNDFLVKNRERNFQKCGKCINKKICGGCRVVAFGIKGDYYGLDNTCFLK